MRRSRSQIHPPGTILSIKTVRFSEAMAYMTWNGFTPVQIEAAVEYTDLVSGTEDSPEVMERILAAQASARRDGWDAIFAGEPATLEALRTTWSRINRYDPADDFRQITAPFLALYGENDYVQILRRTF